MEAAKPMSERIIKGYCVRCKKTVEMVSPEPVWTRRSAPGTRGECPDCGGSVFRLGASYLHDGLTPPAPVKIGANTSNKLPPNTIYINYAAADEETAQQLAADLAKMGMDTWLHDPTPEEVNWAGGVHPALKACSRMVVVLSDAALDDGGNRDAWEFFRSKRKPVVIAQISDMEPPDALRRSARFDFREDYRSAFRQLIQGLAR
jgi:hypothetical protein